MLKDQNPDSKNQDSINPDFINQDSMDHHTSPQELIQDNQSSELNLEKQGQKHKRSQRNHKPIHAKMGNGGKIFQKGKNKPSIKILPLGGLGEIGRNMTVFEYQKEIVIIDCGIMFPDQDHLGVDLLLADFSYLKKNAKNIRALLITHGHEDHIGGVPYFLKEFPGISIYAPKMAMELIKHKLKEHKINYDKKKMNYIEPHKNIVVSPSFKAQFVEVNHSIRDSYGIALTTPAGMIMHTGDFKVEMDSMGSSEFDLHEFARIGSEGVLLLCSDSTNVEKRIEEKTETDVIRNIESLITHSKGRVLIATFASNVNRVIKIVEAASKLDKKVAIIGRSMENNFEIAKKLGYVNPNKNTMIKTQSIKNYPDDKVVVIMTGTQGETLSALTRISQGDHKLIKLKQNDTVIISASVIPGNEKPISKVLNALYYRGVNVHYSRNSGVHVSGHASQENLLLMLRLVKPKFFIPVHGEQRHLILHAKLAQSIGIHPMHTLVAKNGDVIEVSPDQALITGHVPQHTVVVERSQIRNYHSVIEDRKQLSQDGIVLITLNLNAIRDELVPLVHIMTKGFILSKEEKELQMLLEGIAQGILMKPDNLMLEKNKLMQIVKNSMQKIIEKEYDKKPIIEINILELH